MPSASIIDNKDDEKNKHMSNDDFVIYLACLIFLFLFYFWLAYSITFDIYTDNVTSSTAVTQCNPGQCPTDQKTGEKICPEGNGVYAYNITTQVCNYPSLCQGQLPYGVNSDGSVSINGICQTDPVTGLPSNCRCSNQLTCPDYTLLSFDVISGNPYAANTNTQFAQNLISDYGGSGDVITRPNTGFCQIPLQWMLRTQPGCAGVSGSTDFEIAKNCFSLNPCLQGVLAFVTDDIYSVTATTLGQLPVACVRPNYFDENTNGCNILDGYLPFYDLLSNSVICRLICDRGYEPRYNGGIQEGYVAPTNAINGYDCFPSCSDGAFLHYDTITGGFVCSK